MPEVSCPSPKPGKQVMPQYTIKLHTYDPDIVGIFDQLRKNRKQAAFTHEALKHFIASGKSSQMIALMTSDSKPCVKKAAITVNQRDTLPEEFPLPPAPQMAKQIPVAEGDAGNVLKKIFE